MICCKTRIINSSYHVYELLERDFITRAAVIIIKVLEECCSTLGIVSVTCDYLYNYNTQTENICLRGDYALEQVFWGHVSTVEQLES